MIQTSYCLRPFFPVLRFILFKCFEFDLKVLPKRHRETMKVFLKRARAAYGRTALVLSGGAMVGTRHWL